VAPNISAESCRFARRRRRQPKRLGHMGRAEGGGYDDRATPLDLGLYFFCLTSTLLAVGASGVLNGVDVSIVGLLWALSPSQPLSGAIKAQPTSPTSVRSKIFRIIRVPPNWARRMGTGITRRTSGGTRNPVLPRSRQSKRRENPRWEMPRQGARQTEPVPIMLCRLYKITCVRACQGGRN
jgi:hypothetical protein